jgi:hypothetical protein
MRLQLPQDLEYLFVVRLVVNVVDVHVLHNPLPVDNEQGPLGLAIAAEGAVLFGHRSVRPEIAEQGVADAPQAFCPGFQTGDVVYANTQHLGIVAFELVEI